MSLSSILLLCGILGTLTWLAIRDHRQRQAQRRGMLDACVPLFATHELTFGGDGFPRLNGVVRGRHIDVRLISDGMTIRRLPQLWLQVTELQPLEGISGIAVLVRPSGFEFFSLTSSFHYIIEVPPSFPRELIVRGEDAASVTLFEKLVNTLAAILADPCVKEIAITQRGLRIIRQAAEGRRGDYLLLRQCVFDSDMVAVDAFTSALDGINALRATTEAFIRERAHA